MTGAGEVPPLDIGSASKAAVDVISISKALMSVTDVQKEVIGEFRETIRDLRNRNDELSRAQLDYVDQAEQLKEAKDELEEHYTRRNRHAARFEELNAKIKQLDESLSQSQQQVQQRDEASMEWQRQVQQRNNTIQELQKDLARAEKRGGRQLNLFDSDDESVI